MILVAKRMGKDVEEGEISDAGSVEEISKEVFKNQEVVVKTESKGVVAAAAAAGAVTGSKVWKMQDLYTKYQKKYRGYPQTGLVNFAWAQAVQNKPLNEVVMMEFDHEDGVNRSSSPSSSVNMSGGVEKVEIDDSGDEFDGRVVVLVDDEKEEGELEEGEIDLESEPPMVRGDSSEGGVVVGDVKEEKILIDDDSDSGDGSLVSLERRVNSIREALESVVNVVHADKSFQDVSMKFENTLRSLKEVINENSFATNVSLVQQSCLALQRLNSAFCSMNVDDKEQNKETLSRLISLVKSFDSSLFPYDQWKELEKMEASLWTPNVPTGAGVSVKGQLYGNHGFGGETAYRLVNYAMSGFRSRAPLLPLLDLHKDHDVDSLPSPTRETTPCVPAQRALLAGDGKLKLGSAPTKVVNDALKQRFYETDALRAVSSYQQKFGRGSFFSSDRLPSPTPSDDSSRIDGEIKGEVEVNSSPAFNNSKVQNFSNIDNSRLSNSSTISGPLNASLKTVNPITSGHEVLCPSQSMDVSSSQPGLGSAAPVISGTNPVKKASIKSRDPRLRFNSSDDFGLNQHTVPLVQSAPMVESIELFSSRKKKIVEELVTDGPAQKRQRNELETSAVNRDGQTVSGGGRVENNVAGPQIRRTRLADPRRVENGVTCSATTTSVGSNVVTGVIEQMPVTVPLSTAASLPTILKDFAVNPTMLVNLLKLSQQQRVVTEPQPNITNALASIVQPPSLNSVIGSVPLMTIAPSAPSGVLPKSIGTVQAPPQTVPMDEAGKARMKPRDPRMKPRDPRRVLHLQKDENVGSEQVKTNGPSIPNNQASKESLPQNGQGQATQAAPPPDITRLFTNSLKNIADIMSASQPLTSQPVVSQNVPTQPSENKGDRTETKAVISNSDDKQNGAIKAPDVGPTVPAPQNAWGDVEHLFEKYDDKQRAAIQRERAKRLDEQKKMFSQRKLCLVLDLDHTLLNSAKFHEVDPQHDEILRKKEEQDREKPLRHLFRFPHMGMWTKLRPGIWTFLERASKIYELHLYTMGNKLYATEMAKVLDPKGVLFNGRVISKGDDGDPFDGDERVPKSKDLEGVLGMESSVVIIDDSVRVWPHNKLNLIVVERYTYFPSSRRQFGLLGPSLLQIDHDERPEEGTLASSLSVIERLHHIFFSHPSLDDVDVRNILASEQRKILSGCRILFSRVFPVGEANPHLHPLWQTAEQFGAVCTKQMDDQVTHVVANSLGTDKVNWALSTGRFVVHPGWVEASALLYRRANEQDFAIKP